MWLQLRVDWRTKALCLLTSTVASQKKQSLKTERGAWQCPFHIAQAPALLSNAFGAICMLLPTVPSALMLLQLGSLSNLMMTNTAVFLICSWPKNPTIFFLFFFLEKGDLSAFFLP